MAHLPGERPLAYPTQLQVDVNSQSDRSTALRFNVVRGVCGTGSVFVESGNGLKEVKLIALVRGML